MSCNKYPFHAARGKSLSLNPIPHLAWSIPPFGGGKASAHTFSSQLFQPVVIVNHLRAMRLLTFSRLLPPYFLLVLLSAPLIASAQTNVLEWDVARNRVSADIQSLDLVDVLGHVAEATGWRIFLEPDTDRTVSTTFKNRKPDKALDLLLGNLNRILLPPTNGAPRLLVFKTHRNNATRHIKSARQIAREKSRIPIPNEIVIRVKPGTDVEALAKLLGAKVVGSMPELDMYRLRFEDEAAADAARELLASNSEVLGVESNYPVFRDVPSQSFAGGSPLSLTPKAVGPDGQIVVGLIDTALDPGQGGIADFLLPGISVGGEADHPGYEPSHGDSMAQTILRGLEAALNDPSGTTVRILPVDVYGSNPATSTFDVAMGVYLAINAGADIINLSLGSEGAAPILERVIQSGYDQGILFFAAAGNEPGTAVSYPAGYDQVVVAVTSRNRDGSISSFANTGSFVDISAPAYSSIYFGGQLWRVAGTSVSTAYASGAAAALLQTTGMDPKQVEQILRQQMAPPSGSTGR